MFTLSVEMNRIDRLTAILIQLQTKQVVTAQEIADRFEISLRTVYRDVRSLEEAGVPIGAEAGKGYFLSDGFHLPPVMFTPEEANALMLGSKLIEGQTDHSIRQHFYEAMLKIKSVLKNAEKEGLQELEERIEVSSPIQGETTDFPNNFLATIQKALIQDSVLRFKYYSNYNGEYSERQVEPMGLVHYSGFWHLLAYCRLRKAPRNFRVDRLVKLEMIDERFDKSKHSSFKDFMQKMVEGTELYNAKITIRKDVARFVSTQKYYQGFVNESDFNSDYLEMAFLVPSLDYFSRWLTSLGDSIQVLEPDSLKELMKKRAEELTKHYL